MVEEAQVVTEKVCECEGVRVRVTASTVHEGVVEEVPL